MNQRRWTEIEDGPRLMEWGGIRVLRDQGLVHGMQITIARDKMPRTELTRVSETLT